MNKLLIILSAALLSLGLLSGTATAEGYGKQKVVYHINYDDPKKQTGALRNVQNHINAVGAENLDLKIVLHGNGLALVIYPDSLAQLPKFKHANADDTMTAKIDGLKNQGVQIQICANTIKGRNVVMDRDLYDVDEADIVPSGVAQLAHLQGQGYAYIKP